MLTPKEKNRLKKDFRSWGRAAVSRALATAKQYGVLCAATIYSDGKKG